MGGRIPGSRLSRLDKLHLCRNKRSALAYAVFRWKSKYKKVRVLAIWIVKSTRFERKPFRSQSH